MLRWSKVGMFLLWCTCTLKGTDSEFLSHPASVSVMEGLSTVLSCVHRNSTDIWWSFMDNAVSPSFDPVLEVTNNGTTSALAIIRANHAHHSGIYRCHTSDDESEAARVSVMYLSDDIAVSRHIVMVGAGADVTLQCSGPSGTPSPTVRWEKDGSAPLQSERLWLSADSRVLNIYAAVKDDTGVYQCIASNGLGRSVNTSTILVVSDGDLLRPRPKLTVNIPHDEFCAKAYASLSMDCIISPVPTERVQWYHNGGPLVSGKDGYYLRSNFTLAISSVASKHTGIYHCTVNSNPVVTDNAKVVMNCENNLHITLSSSYAVVERQMLLNFTYKDLQLKWEGPEPVKWMRNGVPVLASSRVLLLSNGSLLIRDVKKSDQGNYSAAVMHSSNMMLVTSIALEVSEAPTLFVTISSTAVKLEGSVNISCSSSSSFVHEPLLWLFNGSTLINNDTRHIIVTKHLQSTLVILSVTADDVGTYICTTEDASVSANASLVLATYLYLLPTTLEQQPRSVCNGTNLRLECPFAGGRSRPNITWYLNTKILVNGKEGFLLEREGRVLVVSSAQIQHQGTYTCSITDGSMAINGSFHVTIIIPGSIQPFIADIQTAAENSTTRFDCIVSGIPPPKVYWIQGWTRVTNLNDSSLIELANGSLLIRHVTSRHENTYYCAIQVCYLLDIKKLYFRVVRSNVSAALSETTLAGSMLENIILIAGLGASALMLTIAMVIFVSLCCCCYHARATQRRAVVVRQRAQMAGALRRQASLRLSVRKDNSALFRQSLANNASASILNSVSSENPVVCNSSSAEASVPESILMTTITHTPMPTPVANSTSVSISTFLGDQEMLSSFPRTSLQLKEVVGEGEFGPVVLGWAQKIVPHEEQSQIAVKVLLPHNIGEPKFQSQAVLSDFVNQKKLQHPNIASILGLCTDAEPYYVIYEYQDKGDLKKFLLDPNESYRITRKELCSIVLQVADGMGFLFSQRIIHGDLAARNCLISSQLNVKIADLGIGHDLYKVDYYDNGSQLLPIRWMPPELLSASPEGPDFSLYSDIWSFGVFCWEVFTFACQPYEGFSDLQVLELVPKGHMLALPALACPTQFQQIVESCWNYRPSDRPKFSTLCVAIRKLVLNN